MTGTAVNAANAADYGMKGISIFTDPYGKKDADKRNPGVKEHAASAIQSWMLSMITSPPKKSVSAGVLAAAVRLKHIISNPFRDDARRDARSAVKNATIWK